MCKFFHKLFNIKMWETYDKVSDIFTKPQVKFKAGLWRNDPCFPIYRHGPIINIGKYEWKYTPRWSCHYFDKMVETKYGKIKSYGLSEHKLPVKPNTSVWRRDIRKKLKKYHLGWVPTSIRLPRFFSFHIFNWDVIWKWKYDDIRFELPPQFTIVLFGISFSWWLKAPASSEDWHGYPDDDSYWETILNFVYGGERYKGDLKVCLSNSYYRIDYSEEEHKRVEEIFARLHEVDGTSDDAKQLREELETYGVKKYTLRCRPEYLSNDYKHLFYDILSEMRDKNSKKTRTIYV